MGKRGRPALTPEQVQERISKCQETRAKYVSIVSDTFTIESDANGWSVAVGPRKLYYSSLDKLCECLFKAKLKSSEAQSIRELRNAVNSAKDEILRSVGKIYPPNCI